MLKVLHQVVISHSAVRVDNVEIPVKESGHKMLTELYRIYVKDYPKFFKMDTLCRLGFIASELLLNAERNSSGNSADRAIVFFNKSASLCNDKNYQATIEDGNYFPSPALFVYTLPNIVTGEIAIRNKYYGETNFFILPNKDDETMEKLIECSFEDQAILSVLGGWLECDSEDNFYADICIYCRN